MNPNNLASIDNESVDEVVIGAMALLLEIESCAASVEPLAKPDDITMAVYCDSNQQTAVILRCSRALSTTLTGSMLELTPDEIALDDILDATGELVNVIAGNLRGLVSSPGAMTAPFVLEEEIYAQCCTGAVNNYTVGGESMQVLRT